MRLFKFLLVFQILFVLSSGTLFSSDGKACLPAVVKTRNQQLVLNGSGVRNKYWIDLFTGGLYLKQKSRDAEKIVNANEVMAIKIKVTSDVITASRLEKNMRSEFARVTNGKIGPYKDRIEKLVSAFKEDVKIGDVFDLVYDPCTGLSIYKNNKFQTVMVGLDFKRVLFSTWLGKDPADENLKKGMLGIS